VATTAHPRRASCRSLRPAVEILAQPAGRAACAHRDVAAVYRLLNAAGYSQRRLAAVTAQSQSEISEIFAGRSVTSVHLLERIADGLGCPRAWWRLTGANEHGDLERLSVALNRLRPSFAARVERARCVEAVQELKGITTAMAAQVNALLLTLTKDDCEEERPA
jgi:transcriptional regulator with XRE-family HTH domain